MRTLKGTNHGYRTLFFNLGGNNCLRYLDCRQHDRCRLAFGLDAHGTTCRHNRIDQPLWVGSRRKDTLGIPLRLNRQPFANLIRPPVHDAGGDLIVGDDRMLNESADPARDGAVFMR
jgi:hypothetical protein